MNIKCYYLLLTVVIIATSCAETSTTNPKEVYTKWMGTRPSSYITLIKGQYWESAHWSKEYIMYLKFKPGYTWWNEFLVQNKIVVDKKNWNLPKDAAEWFTPSKNSIRYTKDEEFSQGSRYFRDTITGICYSYEIQL